VVAKALLEGINSQKGGLRFAFKSPNETFGTAHTLFETNAITFDMLCHTGQCVPTNQTAPPRPPVSKLVSAWKIAGICIVATVALLCLWVVVSIRRQRRPVTGSKARALSPLSILQRGGSLGAIDKVEGIGGVVLCFADIGYNVDAGSQSGTPDAPDDQSPKGMRHILRGATGLVRAGEMCAVMGPSGAGKSSLLDILAGHNKNGDVVGQTQLLFDDGSSVSDAEARRNICRYVMQDDRMLATETVDEALTFAACMALPNSFPQDSIPAAVDAVVRQLALQKIRKSRIGSSDAGGLSGGERRRLALGVELITQPAVLLADGKNTRILQERLTVGISRSLSLTSASVYRADVWFGLRER
jgi:ABC-type lipoprotein export system ATPase subunit